VRWTDWNCHWSSRAGGELHHPATYIFCTCNPSLLLVEMHNGCSISLVCQSADLARHGNMQRCPSCNPSFTAFYTLCKRTPVFHLSRAPVSQHHMLNLACMHAAPADVRRRAQIGDRQRIKGQRLLTPENTHRLDCRRGCPELNRGTTWLGRKVARSRMEKVNLLLLVETQPLFRWLEIWIWTTVILSFVFGN
jgi:hypothetical protein